MSDPSKRFKVGLHDRFYVFPLYDENGHEIYELNKAIGQVKAQHPGRSCEVFNDEVSYKITYLNPMVPAI